MLFAHSYVGTFLAVSLLAQYVIGQLSVYQLNNNEGGAMLKVVRVVHLLLGHAEGIVAVANCFLGISLMDPGKTWIYILMVLAFSFVFFWLQWTKSTGRSPIESLTGRFGGGAARVSPYSVQVGDADLEKKLELPVVTVKSVLENVCHGKMWVIYHDMVLDVSSAVASHPGGRAALVRNVGHDVARFFDSDNSKRTHEHLHSLDAKKLMLKYPVARLAGTSAGGDASKAAATGKLAATSGKAPGSPEKRSGDLRQRRVAASESRKMERSVPDPGPEAERSGTRTSPPSASSPGVLVRRGSDGAGTGRAGVRAAADAEVATSAATAAALPPPSSEAAGGPTTAGSRRRPARTSTWSTDSAVDDSQSAEEHTRLRLEIVGRKELAKDVFQIELAATSGGDGRSSSKARLQQTVAEALDRSSHLEASCRVSLGKGAGFLSRPYTIVRALHRPQASSGSSEGGDAAAPQAGNDAVDGSRLVVAIRRYPGGTVSEPITMSSIGESVFIEPEVRRSIPRTILDGTYRGIVLLASGTGILPFVDLISECSNSKSPATTLYVMVSHEDEDSAILHDELEALQAGSECVTIVTFLQKPVQPKFQFQRGYFTASLLRQVHGMMPHPSCVFICGGSRMTAAARRAADEAGFVDVTVL